MDIKKDRFRKIFDDKYEFRLAKKKDIPAIMEYIDKCWKKGHILSQNRENILRVMDTYTEKMSEFRKAVDEGDQERLRELINEANKIRRIIR